MDVEKILFAFSRQLCLSNWVFIKVCISKNFILWLELPVTPLSLSLIQTQSFGIWNERSWPNNSIMNLICVAIIVDSACSVGFGQTLHYSQGMVATETLDFGGLCTGNGLHLAGFGDSFPSTWGSFVWSARLLEGLSTKTSSSLYPMGGYS